MFNRKRTTAEIVKELQDVHRDLADKYCAKVDKDRLAAQIDEILREKVNEYLYQRFRDWQAGDLLELLELVVTDMVMEAEAPETVLESPTIEETVSVETHAATEQPKRRGRPPKGK